MVDDSAVCKFVAIGFSGTKHCGQLHESASFRSVHGPIRSLFNYVASDQTTVEVRRHLAREAGTPCKSHANTVRRILTRQRVRHRFFLKILVDPLNLSWGQMKVRRFKAHFVSVRVC